MNVEWCINKSAAQAAGQTLPVAIPSLGKIPPFTKIAIDALQDLDFPKNWNIVYFMTESTIFNH